VIPQANITAWRAYAPWSDDAQVEQDLALSRAVVELFADRTMTGKVALRGGTALLTVRTNLVELLPGEPWKASSPGKKRPG
jgi:hypothetical protein